MRILSVNVGVSRDIVIKGRPTQTGFDKVPAAGRVPVSVWGLQGDVRIEPRKMGLEHHAIYAYPHEHYAHWQRELERTAFPMGQFGENLTVTGLLETEVRIGDVLRFGTAVLQVAQPRIPCAKLNERMGLRFAPIFLASCKVGYYLRVLQEGDIGAGDSIELLERDPDSPTMEEFVRVTQYEYWDAKGLQELLQARDLMPGWREIIEGKLERTEAAGGWHGLREFIVTRREQEAPDTVSLWLRCARSRPLPPFEGGQHLTVTLGAHTAHQRRRIYALTSDPADLSHYRICVRRVPASADDLAAGVVSSHLVELDTGDSVMCGAPHGKFTLTAGTQDRVPVLLSLGMGLASMLGLLRTLASLHAPRVWLFHQADGPDPSLLWQEIDALMQQHPQWRQLRLPTAPSDPANTLNQAVLHSGVPLDQACFLVAGARTFVQTMATQLQTAGVAVEAIRIQNFG